MFVLCLTKYFTLYDVSTDFLNLRFSVPAAVLRNTSGFYCFTLVVAMNPTFNINKILSCCKSLFGKNSAFSITLDKMYKLGFRLSVAIFTSKI